MLEGRQGGQTCPRLDCTLDDQSFKQIDKLLSRDQRLSGPGFKLYYCWVEDVVIILLVGGDKKFQDHDIQVAQKRMASEE
jgi:putative addiction module killer protein